MRSGSLPWYCVVWVVILFFSAFAWWSNYQECRAHGFSTFYCWSHK